MSLNFLICSKSSYYVTLDANQSSYYDISDSDVIIMDGISTTNT